MTHWGQVTQICVSRLAIIGSDNGLSPGRCQAIIRTNAGILLIEPIGTRFSETLIEIQTFSLKKNTFENVVSAQCCPFCLSLIVLTHMLQFQDYEVRCRMLYHFMNRGPEVIFSVFCASIQSADQTGDWLVKLDLLSQCGDTTAWSHS